MSYETELADTHERDYAALAKGHWMIEDKGTAPKTIKKDIREILNPLEAVDSADTATDIDVRSKIAEFEALMLNAAENLEFEKAAEYRDAIKRLEKENFNEN